MIKDLIPTDYTPADKGQFLVYEAENGQIKIDVRFENETVWLTQKLMVDLFQVTVPTINEHIKNIFDERELVPDATIRKFRIVQKEGQRNVNRMVDCYNLDMIISVGYRVKSHVATRFRIWAITGMTAAEITQERADSDKINMRLTSWRGSKVRKQDVNIAKNYLSEQDRGSGLLRLANAHSALYLIGSGEKLLYDAMLFAVPR